jgi:hypothetical protein
MLDAETVIGVSSLGTQLAARIVHAELLSWGQDLDGRSAAEAVRPTVREVSADNGRASNVILIP